MSVTFDQWIDIVINNAEPEPGFRIQGLVHEAISVFIEWKLDELTNSQAAEILNIDTGDAEVGTVKTYINGLSLAEMLEIERALLLARQGVSATGITYDKALIRTRFGLI